MSAQPSRITSPGAAEHAHELADEQAQRHARASGRWSARRASGPRSDTPALAKPNTGITRKVLQGWSACSSRCRGECAMSSGRAGRGAQRDGQRQQHARDGGVDARAQHQAPQRATPGHQVGPEPRRRPGGSGATSPASTRRGPAEVRQGQVARVEERDDEHRAQVVDDGERGQEHLERGRHARAQRARARPARRRCRWPTGSPSRARPRGRRR